jgi:hypothetical protein
LMPFPHTAATAGTDVDFAQVEEVHAISFLFLS